MVRKTWIGICALAGMLSMPVNVFAGVEAIDDLRLTNAEEYQEIQQLESEVLSAITYPEEFGEILGSIDYAQSVKISSCVDLEKIGSNDLNVIEDSIENNDYVWVVDVKTTKGTVQLQYTLGEEADPNAELSKEALEEINQQAGKWHLAAYALMEESPTIVESVQQRETILSKYDEVMVLWGHPGIYEPIALGFKDGKPQDWIALSSPYLLETKGYLKAASEDGILGDFKTVKQALEQFLSDIEHENTDEKVRLSGISESIPSKESQMSMGIITAICACGIAVLVIMVIVIKNQKNGHK